MTDITDRTDTAGPPRWLRVLAPAGVYLGVRLVGLLGLLWMAAGNGSAPLDERHSWDGVWLLSIADTGYGGVPETLLDAYGRRTPATPFGFFPGYPALVALLGLATGGNLVAAGLVVSVAAGMVAAYGLARLGELVPGGSRRAGLLFVGLFAAAPMAIVLTMTYTEALFCALAVWSLVGVLEHRWLLAGGCCALAGLVRPTAAALTLAVVAAALVAVYRREDSRRPWAGAAIAPTGLLLYLGWVATRTGSVTGWFDVQRDGWGWHADAGVTTARFVLDRLRSGEVPYELVLAATLLGGLVLLVICIRVELPWPLLVYGAAVLLMIWGSAGVMHTKMRVQLADFVLLLPLAIGLANRRTETGVAVLGGLTLVSAWFGGHALVVWVNSI